MTANSCAAQTLRRGRTRFEGRVLSSIIARLRVPARCGPLRRASDYSTPAACGSEAFPSTFWQNRKRENRSMRIWDISPKRLCRNHLRGEHRELYAVCSVRVNGKKGYARHPETLRGRGKLKTLFSRHDALVRKMAVRGYRHQSPLPKRLAHGSAVQRVFVATRRASLTCLAYSPRSCRPCA